MNTFKYKNGYIHENFETGEIKAQVGLVVRLNCVSIHAAKCWITRNKHLENVDMFNKGK